MRVSRINLIRHAVSMTIAFIVAVIVSHFFSLSNEFLIPITAVIVMLTSVGNLIYQGLKRLIVIAIVVVIFSFMFSTDHMFYMRIGDICIGAAIGILINLIVFPRRADLEFRAALLPVLHSYSDYFMGIVDLLLRQNEKEIDDKKIKLESHLQYLPNWVYEKGFDVGLQKGHQYFLMKVHQIAEILFAMHYLARYPYEIELITKIRDPLMDCALLVNDFIKALETVFELKKLSHGVDDFDLQLVKLERKFNSLVPASLELLDMSPEYINFYEFIYDIKDLRNALIKLGQALR